MKREGMLADDAMIQMIIGVIVVLTAIGIAMALAFPFLNDSSSETDQRDLSKLARTMTSYCEDTFTYGSGAVQGDAEVQLRSVDTVEINGKRLVGVREEDENLRMDLDERCNYQMSVEGASSVDKSVTNLWYFKVDADVESSPPEVQVEASPK